MAAISTGSGSGISRRSPGPGLFGLDFAHRFTSQCNLVRSVYQAIEDRACGAWVDMVPCHSAIGSWLAIMVERLPTRSSITSRSHGFLFGQWGQTPVVKNEHVRFR